MDKPNILFNECHHELPKFCSSLTTLQKERIFSNNQGDSATLFQKQSFFHLHMWLFHLKLCFRFLIHLIKKINDYLLSNYDEKLSLGCVYSIPYLIQCVISAKK